MLCDGGSGLPSTCLCLSTEVRQKFCEALWREGLVSIEVTHKARLCALS